MKSRTVLAAIAAAVTWGQSAPAPRAEREDVSHWISVIQGQANQTDRDRAEALVLTRIQTQHLAFPVSPETEKQLRDAGASQAVISAAKQNDLTAADLFSGLAPAARVNKNALLQAISRINSQKTTADRSVMDQRATGFLGSRRLDFSMTSDIETELRRAGASDRLIAAAKQVQVSASELLQSATADLRAGRYQQAAQEAAAAQGIQPSLAALELMAEARLDAGDVAGAENANLEALAAGGEISIRVVLAPSGENFRAACDAVLAVGRKRVSLTSTTSTPECQASAVRAAPLVDSGPNEFVGTDRHAFHILAQSPQGTLLNLSLAPAAGANDWALKVLAAAAKP